MTGYKGNSGPLNTEVLSVVNMNPNSGLVAVGAPVDLVQQDVTVVGRTRRLVFQGTLFVNSAGAGGLCQLDWFAVDELAATNIFKSYISIEPPLVGNAAFPWNFQIIVSGPGTDPNFTANVRTGNVLRLIQRAQAFTANQNVQIRGEGHIWMLSS